MTDGRRNAIIIVAVLAVIVIGYALLNNRSEDAPVVVPTATTAVQNNSNNNSSNNNSSNNDSGIALGDFVVGSSLNADGCVTRPASSFRSTDTIYVGIQPSDFPNGTVFYAQFFVNGELYEETDEITADDDYGDTCVQFNIQAESGAPNLTRGNYEANFYVNGNVADTVTFVVE